MRGPNNWFSADYVENASPDLKKLLTDVAYRYVVINNVTKEKARRDDDVRGILDLVEKLVRHAEAPFHSSEVRDCPDSLQLRGT